MVPPIFLPPVVSGLARLAGMAYDAIASDEAEVSTPEVSQPNADENAHPPIISPPTLSALPVEPVAGLPNDQVMELGEIIDDQSTDEVEQFFNPPVSNSGPPEPGASLEETLPYQVELWRSQGVPLNEIVARIADILSPPRIEP